MTTPHSSRLRSPRSAISCRTTACLTPGELEQVAVDIVDADRSSGSRSSQVDAERRRYELIYEDERMDAWVLSWMPGQGNRVPRPLHLVRRDRASLQGGVREDLLVYGGDDVELHLQRR